jgi:hypothetical protein
MREVEVAARARGGGSFSPTRFGTKAAPPDFKEAGKDGVVVSLSRVESMLPRWAFDTRASQPLEHLQHLQAP